MVVNESCGLLTNNACFQHRRHHGAPGPRADGGGESGYVWVCVDWRLGLVGSNRLIDDEPQPITQTGFADPALEMCRPTP